MTFTPTRVALPFAIAAVALATTSSASAQSHPFPSAGGYAKGFLPSAVTTAVVQASYDSWKTKYLLGDCGNSLYRVDNGGGDGSTFSEGQGYGMVLTAYFGDKAAFDGLWAFAKKNFNQNSLMGWHVTCGGPTSGDGGAGSASDGDTDVGFALLVAAAQWGGTYLQDAKTYLASLEKGDFSTCSPSGRNLPMAGNWQGNAGCSQTNTSYWMPAYYRVFGQVTGDSFWTKAADDTVALYNMAADPKTGIIVNEVDQNGGAVAGQTYDYNSCRIPWRAALDYLWYGTSGAAQAATKITSWANGVGISKIVDGYQANGTPTGQYTGLNAFVGGFTAGAMSNSQSLVDSFATYFVTIADDNGGYYGASLRTLYLLALSGHQWNPAVALEGGVGDGGAGSSSGSAGSSSGSGGSSSGGKGGHDAGGVSSSSGGTSSGGDGGAPNGEAPKAGSGGGCGCGVAPEDAGVVAPLAVAAGLALAARRRRRR